ncbi:hypothetical protein LMJ53_14280 [Rheinheimera sp. UJ51]|uniref:hypothetical protein n=1 Tax=unclassified Rheinheimera TaxID=115860 RepID=UPI001E518DB3|nr:MULTISPECIES: hypothetical protein [unclassified Rheinheimera]MCC5452891.1 hypothetical protein [Rheinheimera sp. UJ51]MCF4010605.1 hypothetical protein [Rheinheimera sp. UJ63]
MSSSTIFRVLTTFIEIIPASPNFLSSKQIAAKLAELGMDISQSQLSRDLNEYAAFFNVQECEFSYEGSKCWQRFSKTPSAATISETDMAILSLIKENMDTFPAFTQESLNQKLADLSKKQAVMHKVNPKHRIFEWQKNRDLIIKFERQNIIDNALLKALMQSLNHDIAFKYTTDESASKVYSMKVHSLSEENNQLVIHGFLSHENTHEIIKASSINIVKNNPDHSASTHVFQQQKCSR